ncbi:hypothetical protein ACJX0J_031121, partial [Zea mays]
AAANMICCRDEWMILIAGVKLDLWIVNTNYQFGPKEILANIHFSTKVGGNNVLFHRVKLSFRAQSIEHKGFSFPNTYLTHTEIFMKMESYIDKMELGIHHFQNCVKCD